MSTAVVSPPRCSNAVYLPAAQVIWIRVQSRISQSWRDRTQHASIDLSPIDFVLKHLKERWPSVRGKGGISSPEENRGLPPRPSRTYVCDTVAAQRNRPRRVVHRKHLVGDQASGTTRREHCARDPRAERASHLLLRPGAGEADGAEPRRAAASR
jgi:hypothetical protein